MHVLFVYPPTLLILSILFCPINDINCLFKKIKINENNMYIEVGKNKNIYE